MFCDFHEIDPTGKILPEILSQRLTNIVNDQGLNLNLYNPTKKSVSLLNTYFMGAILTTLATETNFGYGKLRRIVNVSFFSRSLIITREQYEFEWKP